MKLSLRIAIFGIMLMLVGVGLISASTIGNSLGEVGSVGFVLLFVGALIVLIGIFFPDSREKADPPPKSKDDDPEQKS